MDTRVVLALLSGWFDRRKLALGGAFVVCAAWLVLPLHPSTAGWFREEVAKGELRMSMLSVGDGSCYVLRVPEANGERVVMFDCGSKRLMDVGSRIVIPALRYMGVERIDTIILSHADLDHFCGVLDLQKGIPIDRILAPAHLLEDAVSRPRSAAAFLVNELKAQGLVVTSISRGWKEAWGDVRAEVLWPPVECDLKSKNDTSIVMRIETGGRRILMNGDIANQAIGELLESNEDLRADVVELPHHGSFVSRSLSWLKAVSPSVALQSCGRVRMIGDRWGEPLTELGAEHLVSSRAGQTEISITSDGRMRWRAFVGKRWNQVEPDVRPEMAISSSSP